VPGERGGDPVAVPRGGAREAQEGGDGVKAIEAALREAVVEAARAMNARGINRGTSGNVSARVDGGMIVTPTGAPYESMRPEDLVATTLEGRVLGAGAPSSEWPFHAAVYRARADVGAVVHAHPIAATALSCLRRGIPPFHYMVAVAGGTSIECSRYATFGTDALADAVVEALGSNRACLIANHGMLAAAATPDAALALAVEVEALAAQYLAALSVGEPVLLSEAEMAEVRRRIAGYGPWAGTLPPPGAPPR
jgi:L-fuculose-phosphate aldolase